jgi:hypothetical protein
MKRRGSFIALLVWPFIAAGITFATHANLLTAGILFYGVPALALTTWRFRYAPKIAVFSLATATGFGIPFEYIIRVTRQYIVPSSALGDARLFQYVVWDMYIGYILWIYATAYVYAVFFDNTSSAHVSPDGLWRLLRLLGVVFAVFSAVYVILPGLLVIPYFYLIFGCGAIATPLILILARYPKLRSKIMRIGFYSLVVNALVEFTALSMGYWYFPSDGSTVGRIGVGILTLSLEELAFFVILPGAAIAAYYEYFADNAQ